MLEKPTEYQEVPAQQGEETVYAEDINQIISNIEKIKGGQANEAPISNIKDLHSSINELKERIDGLGNGESSQLPSSADKIAFNNDNANLDFSAGYDFPPFKNELKESYEIKLITDYSFNECSHIDDIQDIHTLILEKNMNKYILKGNLKYNNKSSSSSMNFYLISINNNNDLGYVISEILQFLSVEKNAKENEITIENIQNLKYSFSIFVGIPIFTIKSDINFDIKEYDIAINIEISDIKNNQDFIPTVHSSFINLLTLKNINNKAVITGEIKKEVVSVLLMLFSYSALENYFDIKTDQNDSYYIEANNMITSNKNKPLKYYIRKLITDGAELSPKFANITMTYYYLEIKHTDGSNIEYEEILTFNLTAPKNADVQKIEKDKNIQNAVEILNSKIIDILNYLGLNSEEHQTGSIFTFEKTTLYLENIASLNADIIEDINNLSLVSNDDGSLNIKGSMQINAEGMGVIRVNKKLKLDKRKLIAMSYKDIQIIYKYQDDYLYIIIMASKVQNTTFNLESIKIYDSNIICPADSSYIKLSGNNISDDFGIYLENGVYKLKGSFTSSSNSMQFFINLSIQEFFENAKTYNYDLYNIEVQASEPLYSMITISGVTPNQEYLLNIECPLQPSILQQ
ncbi:hypothetical protein [uncultured Brachyspira sp.]|uniref:hypothetical protein n=1 Tax=uncultured Brachyspira sp. TaxID=221953 RepID=UPI00262298F0|nr:hypothetical protein [uncultured Brachyspira sp.]